MSQTQTDRKTAIVTGATGQDGSYLCEFLLKKGYTVYGIIRRSSVDTTERLASCKGKSNFHMREGDITDFSCMARLISGIQPDEFYNLAAMSHVGTSFDQPITTSDINAVGPLNILESIRQYSPETRFYQASTSELFGDTEIAPQDEDTPLNPNSPYAVAKLYAHQMTGLYRRAYQIFACAGILFNHESERRGDNFVTRKITKYVGSVKAFIDSNGYPPIPGRDIEKLKLGNVEAKRDWSHAMDMVEGMWLMLQQDVPDDYVLGSGRTHTVEDFLRKSFEHIGLDYQEYFEVDPALYRPADVNLLLSDPSKAREQLGWRHKVSFDNLVERMVEHDYREAVDQYA